MTVTCAAPAASSAWAQAYPIDLGSVAPVTRQRRPSMPKAAVATDICGAAACAAVCLCVVVDTEGGVSGRPHRKAHDKGRPDDDCCCYQTNVPGLSGVDAVPLCGQCRPWRGVPTQKEQSRVRPGLRELGYCRNAPAERPGISLATGARRQAGQCMRGDHEVLFHSSKCRSTPSQAHMLAIRRLLSYVYVLSQRDSRLKRRTLANSPTPAFGMMGSSRGTMRGARQQISQASFGRDGHGLAHFTPAYAPHNNSIHATGKGGASRAASMSAGAPPSWLDVSATAMAMKAHHHHHHP